jgi:hypothetical protein
MSVSMYVRYAPRKNVVECHAMVATLRQATPLVKICAVKGAVSGGGYEVGKVGEAEGVGFCSSEKKEKSR